MHKYDCRNYMEINCDDRVKHSSLGKKLEPSESIPTELNEFSQQIDAICKACEHRIFKIHEKICPVCGENNFRGTKGFTISNDDDQIKFQNEYLICEHCNTKLEFQIIS